MPATHTIQTKRGERQREVRVLTADVTNPKFSKRAARGSFESIAMLLTGSRVIIDRYHEHDAPAELVELTMQRITADGVRSSVYDRKVITTVIEASEPVEPVGLFEQAGLRDLAEDFLFRDALVALHRDGDEALRAKIMAALQAAQVAPEAV